jgi:hypothetical protein
LSVSCGGSSSEQMTAPDDHNAMNPNAPHGPPRSQATPVTGAAPSCPMRMMKLSRPAYCVFPYMYWPIMVWAPSQPIDSDKPKNSCRKTSAQIHGIAG